VPWTDQRCGATVDEDGQYSSAVALCCWSLRPAQSPKLRRPAIARYASMPIRDTANDDGSGSTQSITLRSAPQARTRRRPQYPNKRPLFWRGQESSPMGQFRNVCTAEKLALDHHVGAVERRARHPQTERSMAIKPTVKFTREPCSAPARAATGLLYQDGIMVYSGAPLCELTL
jgi:hypothetical protein